MHVPKEKRPRGHPERVRAAVAEAVLSLPEAKGNPALPRLVPHLLAPEPVVEEMPLYFLPSHAADDQDEEVFAQIGVGGKLLYAQARWLDDLADSGTSSADTGAAHHLSGAVAREARRRFQAALCPSERAARFFSSLSDLYSRYATSLALDAGLGSVDNGALTLDAYVEHAKARAALPRAPLEALLALTEASDEQYRRARSSFDLCVAGLQLNDDALDAEEDYKRGTVTWIISETLAQIGEPRNPPDADEFYENALRRGIVQQSLDAANACFEEARTLATGHLPLCAEYLEEELHSTRSLSNDFKALVAHSLPPTSA